MLTEEKILDEVCDSCTTNNCENCHVVKRLLAIDHEVDYYGDRNLGDELMMTKNGTEIRNYDLKIEEDDKKIVIIQTIVKDSEPLGDGFRKTDKKGSRTDYLLNGVPRYKDDKGNWHDGKVFHDDKDDVNIVYSFKPAKVTKTVYD